MEQLKTCSKCKRELPTDRFYKNKSSSDGFKSWCKLCIKNGTEPIKARARAAAWYKANRERALAGMSARYKNNPEKHYAQTIAWRKANEERYKASNAAYYKKNRSKLLEQNAAWRATHKFEMKKKSNDWYRANRERCYEQSLAWAKANPEKRRAIEKSRDAKFRQRFPAIYKERSRRPSKTLSDAYVCNVLRLADPLIANFPRELIEAKREQLKMYRVTKQLITTLKEKQNGTK